MKLSTAANVLFLVATSCHAFQPVSQHNVGILSPSVCQFPPILRATTLEDISADVSTEKSMTQRIMEKTNDSQSSGAGGSSTWEAFLRTEANWARLKSMEPFEYDDKLLADQAKAPSFVTDDAAKGNTRAWDALREISSKNKALDYDVVICGGTLGVFFATSLLLRNPNMKIAILEAGKLQGRAQEWNISYNEMEELVELGVLSKEDVKACITTQFPG
jgi:hypothetical protein